MGLALHASGQGGASDRQLCLGAATLPRVGRDRIQLLARHPGFTALVEP
jgi:hypothetical protein